jgi:hypothetical protein
MRKTIVLMAAVAAMLALVAGTALAQKAAPNLTGAVLGSNQQLTCQDIPCYATGSSDLVNERIGNGRDDRILLRGGDDRVNANTYGRDRDVIKGHRGYDLIHVDDGDTRDKIYGGKGGDKCYVDSRSEAVSGCGAIRVR